MGVHSISNAVAYKKKMGDFTKVIFVGNEYEFVFLKVTC